MEPYEKGSAIAISQNNNNNNKKHNLMLFIMLFPKSVLASPDVPHLENPCNTKYRKKINSAICESIQNRPLFKKQLIEKPFAMVTVSVD